jgi:hypothetical protein
LLILLFQVVTDNYTTTYMRFIYQTNIPTQCNFCHTCFSSCISNIRENKIILLKLYCTCWVCYVVWYTHEPHCLLVIYTIQKFYTSSVSDIALLMAPYFIIVCSGNLTKLPLSIFFGLINTHKFVITYPDVCTYAVM